MKKIFVCFSFIGFLLACNNEKTNSETSSTDSTASKPMTDLPYTASYSSHFTQDVSDADLKTVLMSYKYWENGDMAGLAGTMGDSAMVNMNTGDHFNGTNADLMKIWSKYRDSLSSVVIDMDVWQKAYEPDKKDAAILTWYKETDTYKNGRVDSAYYHDINGLKDGKIVFYSQYKRPAK